MADNIRPVSPADKETAFREATRALPIWFARQIATGMTDTELESALKRVLGVFGGSCGPGRLCVSYQGSGLKIWGSWHIHVHAGERPLFCGQATVRMARVLYHIPDPTEAQFSFL